MSCVKRHSVLFEFGPSILSFFGQKVLCTSKGFLENVSKLSVAIANLVNLGHSEDFTPPSSEVGTEFLHEHTYFPVKKNASEKIAKNQIFIEPIFALAFIGSTAEQKMNISQRKKSKCSLSRTFLKKK